MSPRIRTLKPEIWADEKVAIMLPDAEHRELFIGLITMADDEGRLPDAPAAILGHIYPYQRLTTRAAVQLEKRLDTLREVGLVRRYWTDGIPVISLPGWHRHQRISRPTPSKLPAEQNGEVHPDQGVFLTERARSGSAHAHGTSAESLRPSRAEARVRGSDLGADQRQPHDLS